MFEVLKSNWFILTGFPILTAYILYYFDKKRISDPCYKFKIEKKRNEMKLKKMDKLKYQLMAFPISNNMKNIKNFVNQEIEKGEECIIHENYNKAAEHFANGLSMIDNNSKLLNMLSTNVPPKVYREVRRQMQDIETMLPEIQKLN